MSIKLNYRTAALRICVDRVEDACIRGKIISQRLRSPMSFSDVNELMIQIDLLLDAQKFPQAFQQARSFLPNPKASSVPAAFSPEEMLSADEVDSAQGGYATFLLNITTRQHSTWQGFVDWLDGSPQQTFNSTLEFLKFFEEKLSMH